MEAIDLLSPSSIGFKGEKTSPEAPQAGGAFEEILARQEQQVRGEAGDEPSEELKRPVGILTNDDDATSPADEDSTAIEPNPANFQGDSKIPVQAEGSTSSWTGELSDRVVNPMFPQDREGSGSEGANDREPRVPTIFVPCPFEPASSGSAWILQDRGSTPNPLIVDTDSQEANPDPERILPASFESERVTYQAPGSAGSSPIDPGSILPPGDSGLPFLNERQGILAGSVKTEGMALSTLPFISMSGPEKGDAEPSIAIGSLEGSEIKARISPESRMESPVLINGIENPSLGKSTSNPSLPVQEGKGLSLLSSPEEWGPAEKISSDMKQDSLSPGVRTENPLPSRSTLLVNSSDKVTSLENPSLFGKGGDGFSFSSSSEEWGSTEGFLFNQKEILKPSGQLDAAGPHGILPSQASEGLPDPGPVTGRQEVLSSDSPRLDTADAEDVKLYQHVSKGMVKSFGRHGERIELALEPPELGSLFIEVKRENGSLKAILWTDNPETKSMLENNQTHLHNLLKEDGLALEKFDVVFHQDMKSFHARERAPGSHQGREEKKSKEDGISALSDPLELRGPSKRVTRSGEYSLDLIV